jgi:glycosyltransferase involved in cell wall biosynthesis
VPAPDRSLAPTRILELRSVRGTGGGPEKTILLGAARADRSRFAVTVCYIRDLRDDVFAIDHRARGSAVDYVEISERHSFDPAVWGALRRLVRERQIDIVHAHDYKTDLLAWALARVEPVVPLSTAHGWSRSSVRELGYFFADKLLLARYPLVIAVSEPIRRALIVFGARPERVRRVLNGIDPVDFRRVPGVRESVRRDLGLSANDHVIGTIGRLERVKRFDILLEAVTTIERVSPIVVVAGEGSCRNELEERAKALGLADRVRWLGLRNDAKEIHQAFDVYVQSSETEGVSNAVLEAMALETPIVATEVGGTGELIEDGVHGLLVPKNNPEALAGAISRTLADPEATRGRVANARRRVEEELSFDARTRTVERIYDELMQNRRHVTDRGRRENVGA